MQFKYFGAHNFRPQSKEPLSTEIIKKWRYPNKVVVSNATSFHAINVPAVIAIVGDYRKIYELCAQITVVLVSRRIPSVLSA